MRPWMIALFGILIIMWGFLAWAFFKVGPNF